MEPLFLAAAKVQDVKPGRLRGVRLRGGHELGIANVEGQFYAFEAYCPHQRWPLKWGVVEPEQNTLVCALHMWRFDLETGAAVDPPLADCLKTYPVRVEGEMVYVGVEGM
ncbi:MAG TPA: Rieske (2Fe-2S) protein [Chloroflexota bacterium]|nr:Rieske (2Fe-2S) protein [Chloroflexota bacterium]